MAESLPSNDAKSSATQGGLRRITGHPAFQLFSLLIGILGVALAVFFYVRSQREREPYFFVQGPRNVIVNRELTIGQRLTVQYEGRAITGETVVAMQVVVLEPRQGTYSESRFADFDKAGASQQNGDPGH